MRKDFISKQVCGLVAALCLATSICCMPTAAITTQDAPSVATTETVSATDTTGDIVNSNTDDVTENPDAQGAAEKTDGASMQEIGDVLSEAMTIDSDELQAGAKLAAPLAKLIRTCISVVMALLSVIILANSIWDIVCISVRPLCQRVATGQTNSEDLPSKLAAWASHDALVAIQKAGVATATATPAGGAAGGFGGSPMGGFGAAPMGGFGGAPMGPQANNLPKAKQILPIYFRKRIVFLVLFGVCLAIFCTSTFTDLGLQFGAWIAEKVGTVSVG